LDAFELGSLSRENVPMTSRAFEDTMRAARR
jgi:hypothetical protein